MHDANVIPFETPFDDLPDDAPVDDKKAAKQFYVNRMMWIEDVCTHSEIQPVVARVATFIAVKTNARDLTCWWSVAKIAKQVGCNRSTVSHATQSLERLGLLNTARRKGGRNNIYSLRFRWLPDEP